MPDSPLREALFADLDAELAATRRMLARVPWDRADFRPHPRSMSLGSLARHLATLPRLGAVTMLTDALDLGGVRPPTVEIGSTDELLALWDEMAEALRDAIEGADDARLSAPWPLTMGEHTVAEDPRHVAIRRWGLSHIAHHRGQLTVYLRLLDVPVPGVYGPTADEKLG